MDWTGLFVDCREISPTENPNILLKSEFFYPSRQYRVNVTTVRNQYQNTYEKVGVMKTHRPVIDLAEVDENDGAMVANWGMNNNTYSNSIKYDLRIIDQFSYDDRFTGKGTTKTSTRTQAFDKTRVDRFEVRA